jgi:membrane-associated phospholipid phosphatase
MRFAVAAMLAVPVLAFGEPAPVADHPGRSPYDVDLAVELPLSAVLLATWTLPSLLLPHVKDLDCPCDRDRVPSFDRGWIEPLDERLDLVSTIGSIALVGLPFLAGIADARLQGGTWRDVLDDSIVFFEAVAICGSLNQLARVTVERPRPLLYHEPAGSARFDTAEEYASFFSGHTGLGFAATLALGQTYAARHPGSPWVYAIVGGGAAASAGVGVLRIASGKHFVSDVLVGTAVGISSGALVPWLHRRGTPVRAAATPLPGGFAAVVEGRF